MMDEIVHFSYDYILDVRNLSEELAFILRKLGFDIEMVPHLHLTNDDEGHRLRKEALKSLSKNAYQILIDRYRDDFDAFGFDIPIYENLVDAI